jgi:hypothetical protein
MANIRSSLTGLVIALTFAFARVSAVAQAVGDPAANPVGDPTPAGQPYPFDPSLPPAVICTTNVDGTVVTNHVTMLPPPINLHPHFRITEDGVVGEGGAFQISADGNLASAPISITGPTGQKLRLRVSAIAASDARTGKRMWLATLRDCQ